jgi:hypothetical protein
MERTDSEELTAYLLLFILISILFAHIKNNRFDLNRRNIEYAQKSVVLESWKDAGMQLDFH